MVTGDRVADFLLADVTLMNGLFDQAFTEYVWLTDAGASDPDLLFTQLRLPYDGVLPPKLIVGGGELDQWQSEWLTRKWLQHADRQANERVSRSNHQALFTLGRFWKTPGSLSTSFGQTSVGSKFNDTWLPVLAIENRTMVAEATVHELAHQWRVNHGGANPNAKYGHCGWVGSNNALPMSGEGAPFCTMTTDLYLYPEARDGKVGFHHRKFGGVVDSEYLRIRRRPDPVPQNEEQRNPPQ